jgi:outer membrane protein assembly factor BamD (BamD/ComL family)
MRIAAALGICALTLSIGAVPIQNESEVRARGWFAHGTAMRDQGNYEEALKDFRQIVDTLPESSVADKALLEVARYQFDVQRDLDATEQTLIRLKKDYSKGEAIPWAWVLSGRISLARRESAARIASAVNDLERVAAIYPDSDAVPAALYYRAEADRLSRRTDAAKQEFLDVAQRYSRNEWAAKALLGAARCHVDAGDGVSALQAAQRVRDRFPNSPEAAAALNWTTILYRLYIRARSEAPFDYVKRLSGSATAIKDVKAIGVTADGEVMAVLPLAVANLSAPQRPLRMPELVRDLQIDWADRLWGASAQHVMAASGPPVLLPIPHRPDRPNEHPQVEDISSFVVTSIRDLLVADHGHGATYRFTSAGKYVAKWIDGAPDRMAIDPDDNIAIPKNESVSVFDREGRPQHAIPRNGTGYEMKSVRDLAYDSLGHLYVLDRSHGAIFIFSPSGQYMTQFELAEKSPGAFRKAAAIAVDHSGRLYIYDERAEAIQVYE